MSPGDGYSPGDGADKSLGEIVGDVSEKASLLVREEIELAKAEVKDKISKLTKGAAVAGAAGVFLIFGITMLFHTLGWFLFDLFNFSQVWMGFAIVTGALFVLAALAGLVALRLFKRGSPPTPELAIEEAKRTREELEHQKIERDQVGRTLDKGEELPA
ncbi:MAG: phage holin family protein [Thermoleophilaceae bacterium]